MIAWSCMVAALTLAAAEADVGGLRYRLEEIWPAGLEAEVNEEDSLLLVGHQVRDGRRVPLSQSVVRRAVCRLRVEALDADGRIARMTRHYRHASLVVGGVEAAGESFCSYHGKTVIAERVQNRVRVTVDGRPLPRLERPTFQHVLAQETRRRLFPPEPVPVGAQWLADLEALAAWFDLQPEVSGQVQCVVESVRPEGDDRLVRIGLKGEVRQPYGGATMTLRIEGAAEVLVGVGHVTRVEVSGQVELRSAEPGLLDASGTWHRLRTSRPLTPPLPPSPATEASSEGAVPRRQSLGAISWLVPAGWVPDRDEGRGLAYAVFVPGRAQAVGTCRVRPLGRSGSSVSSCLARFRVAARARQADILSTESKERADGLSIGRLECQYREDGRSQAMIACGVLSGRGDYEILLIAEAACRADARRALDALLDSLRLEPQAASQTQAR